MGFLRENLRTTHVSDHSFFNTTMPRRYRRSKRPRKYGRRSFAKKRAIKRSNSRTKKYSSSYGLSRPLRLKLPRAGFPSLMRTKLRFCTTVILDPGPGTPDTQQTFSYRAYSTNSLVAPLVGSYINENFVPFAPLTTSKCYMGHDDYSRVYSNYRVTGTSISVSCQSDYRIRALGQAPGVPSYVSLRTSNELPGHDMTSIPCQQALVGMTSMNSMRAAGTRFIKIDPDSIGVPGPGVDGVRRQGRTSRQVVGTSWSSKMVKKYSAEDTQAMSKFRPKAMQYFILSAQSSRNQVGDTASKDPVPVRCFVTIEANVTYWRQKGFPIQPTLANITEGNPDEILPV